jgi:hypothetical protein
MAQQKCNSGSSAEKMKEELEKTGLVYIWQNRHENNINKLSTVIKERRNAYRETTFILEDGKEDFTNFFPGSETQMGECTIH